MKKSIFAVVFFASLSCHAENDPSLSYKVEGDGGVSKTVVQSWNTKEPGAPKFFWVTTASAQAYNVNGIVNRPMRASGTHKSCWNNDLPFSVTARYVYTIEANGKRMRVTNSFMLPRFTIKCVTQDTYVITSFPIMGNFMYTVLTHAETNLTVPHDARSTGYLMVRV